MDEDGEFESVRQGRRNQMKSEIEYRDRSRSPPKTQDQRAKENEFDRQVEKLWSTLHDNAKRRVQNVVFESGFELFKISVKTGGNLVDIQLESEKFDPEGPPKKKSQPHFAGNEVIFGLPHFADVEFHILEDKNMILFRVTNWLDLVSLSNQFRWFRHDTGKSKVHPPTVEEWNAYLYSETVLKNDLVKTEYVGVKWEGKKTIDITSVDLDEREYNRLLEQDGKRKKGQR